MKKLLVAIFWLILMVVTWAVSILHLSVIVPPAATSASDTNVHAKWFSKSENGINHMVLEGTDFERGFAAGKQTSALIERQEAELIKRFEQVIPNALVRGGFILGLIRWFWGFDQFFGKGTLDEIYGVSLSTSHKWDGYIDRYGRQIAYHGLHEVGQFFADFGAEGAGCTVFLVPQGGHWNVARNFDFEGGRIFDEEKIVKWIFPKVGYPFVHVIWAGMLGAVTGVNSHGVYISINAAGTTDVRRYGTPSTLVALNALQFSKTALEAKQIIEDATIFITDIFVVVDRTQAFRIEKSPLRFRSTRVSEPTVITNHLEDPLWKEDRINKFRRDSLTSLAREVRGKELLASFPPVGKHVPLEQTLVGFLRDKKGVGAQVLPLGHRSSVDALIATHAVVYQSEPGRLFVGEGPSLVGPFRGYDLAHSFAEKRPIEVAQLAADPAVSKEGYYELKSNLDHIAKVHSLIVAKQCKQAAQVLSEKPPLEHPQYFITKGELMDCLGQKEGAKDFFRRALELNPPYESQRNQLKEKVKG